jgi:hypothetical protein
MLPALIKMIGDPKNFCSVTRTAAGAAFSTIGAPTRLTGYLLDKKRRRSPTLSARHVWFNLSTVMLPIKEDSEVQVADPFRPYERLVKIKLMKKTVEVPEKNSLLRCFQFLSPETIPYGRFCWNQDCQYCRVMAKLPDDDKPREMLSCKFMVMPGMEITEISPELKLCLKPILRK